MAVLDSSALIHLAQADGLWLIDEVYEEPLTTEGVFRETVEEGGGRKPGASEISELLEDCPAHEEDDSAADIAEAEGVSETDAALILLALEEDEILLTNDKALVGVAGAKGVEPDWVTTVLLRAAKQGVVGSEEAKEMLYELVNSGMNLSPSVYTKVRRRLDEVRVSPS
jgi:predicted nucleic acid-binding protein